MIIKRLGASECTELKAPYFRFCDVLNKDTFSVKRIIMMIHYPFRFILGGGSEVTINYEA